MSASRDNGRRRASRVDADPWWAQMASVDAEPTSGGAARVQTRTAGKRANGVGRVQASFQRAAERVQPRQFRRRTMVVTAILIVCSCAVGAITLNNLVIERSAELGKLDLERRELRTENALLAADIAQLSAPPRITKLARKRLGMQQGESMSQFIYLDPMNRPYRPSRTARPGTGQGRTTHNATPAGRTQQAAATATAAPDKGRQ